MNTDEVAEMLGRMAVIDKRSVGKIDILTWEELLPPELTLTEALEIIRDHRRTKPGVYLEPGHISVPFKTISDDRLRRAGDPPIPGGHDDDPKWEIRWRRAWCAKVRGGQSREEAEASTNIDFQVPPEIPTTNAGRAAQINAFASGLAVGFGLPEPDDLPKPDPREEASQLAPYEAFAEIVDDRPTGRRLIHSFCGSVGADLELAEVQAMITSADTVIWIDGINDHDLCLRVKDPSGGTRRYVLQLRRPKP